MLKAPLLLKKNTRCTPAVISTLATLGYAEVRVNSLPKVSLFTTGNEVKPLGTPVSSVEIRNSNSYLLKSLLKNWNISPVTYLHLPDDKNELRSAINTALNSDIIILSGGVSAGDADYVPEVLENLGVKKLFHKVAIKPGKPIWCGIASGGPMVFALPGNPFSSLVTFKIFVEPFIQKALELYNIESCRATLYGDKDKKTPLDEFFPAKFVNSGRQLVPTQLNGSGDIRLGIEADALGVHPSGTNLLEDGSLVEYYKL